MLMPLPNGALMSVAPNDSILMQFDVRVDARWEGYCHRQTGLTVAAFLVCQCARELKREVLFAAIGAFQAQRQISRHGLSPLLETDLFGNRAFNVGALLILFFWGSTTPFSFSYVLLMQTGYGHSPLATAGSLAILGGAFGIVSPIAGRLTSFGVRRIMMAGVLVDLVGMLLALVLC
jgi:predicted MFS family arabinose efflux permease